MSGNQNMAYFANFENNQMKTRVLQAPGGQSQFSLGWSKPIEQPKPRQQNYGNNYQNNIMPVSVNAKNMYNQEPLQDFGNSLQMQNQNIDTNQLTGAERRHVIVEMNRERDAHEKRYQNLIERSVQDHYEKINGTPVKNYQSPLELGYMRYKNRVEEDVPLKYLKQQDEKQNTANPTNPTNTTNQVGALQTKYKENRFNNIMNDFPSTNKTQNPYGNMYDNMKTTDGSNGNLNQFYKQGYHQQAQQQNQNQKNPSDDTKIGKKIWQPPGGASSFSFY